MYRLGIDIGSTTAKAVVRDNDEKTVFSKYVRHNADIAACLDDILQECENVLGDCELEAVITGSAGLGVSERIGLPFVQEVIAVSNFVQSCDMNVNTLIDIGGEDAKIIFFNKGKLPLMRMNGNCAGGTGAFIDQMAVVLGVKVEELDALALKAKHIHPIASRCGVFSKTDVQNLVAKAVSKEDIAASIFNAIALQVISSLSKGLPIKPRILFCGGPLTYIQSLRDAFKRQLDLKDEDIIRLDYSNLIPAIGCLYSKTDKSGSLKLSELKRRLKNNEGSGKIISGKRLPAIFKSEEELTEWQKQKRNSNRFKTLDGFASEAFLGIDSGSTTTKLVLTDTDNNILFSDYSKNAGNPLKAVQDALDRLQKEAEQHNAKPNIVAACSTGYGEELIKAAFGLDYSMVETIAHYKAAKVLCPDVDFILDIGGQDMKAMYIKDGVLNKIELNEACSSGCGSFIETFAASLGYKVAEFAHLAALAENPCDLGTRCTVFMNSKVKQSLREGATVADIAAGLSYSVVKNCLYKVLKIGSADIGNKIVVQGGTMKNDAVVKAFENMTGKSVFRSSAPELMGAYGCAITACENYKKETKPRKEQPATMPHVSEYTSKELHCHGCENKCLVTKYVFANGKTYHSGNKCEKVFTSKAESEKGDDIYAYKLDRVFERNAPGNPVLTLGVPRVLNMFEDFPFWQALFASLDIELALSDLSTYGNYEKELHDVMSENICFPAKLVHSHIKNLVDKGIKDIFFPYVVYEKKDDETTADSYNCPIVSSYNTIIENQFKLNENCDCKIDNPVFNFKDEGLLLENIVSYVQKLARRYPSLIKADRKQIKAALQAAISARNTYETDIKNEAEEYLRKALSENRQVIVLAARPYHCDSLIQHKLSTIISELGATVVSDDLLRNVSDKEMKDTYMRSQWAYMNRIVKTAKWTAQQGDRINYIQITSFGCGPDAFLLDEVENIFRRYGKVCTIIKVDDINNVGSMRLRVRSLLESLRLKQAMEHHEPSAFIDTKTFELEDKPRTILAPFFTDYASPFLPQVFELSGYKLEVLPESDEQSVEIGLRYSNNEVCYPATLIVGDLIKALQSGKYDLSQTAVGITQTGGQCRASSYYAVIRKALVDAGFEQVPVISVTMDSGVSNNQPGFALSWLKIVPIAFSAVLFGDALSLLYHATVARTENKTEAKKLRDGFVEKAKPLILARNRGAILKLLGKAVDEFGELLPNKEVKCKRVGIVGEIFLKFNGFANKNVIRWLIDQGIEVIPPMLTPFFTQSFVNREINVENKLDKSSMPKFVYDFLYKLVRKEISKFNKVLSRFRYPVELEDIYELAKDVKEVLPLYTQFGEGWLLPAEIVSYAKSGADAVISLQPFGCIANHIISRGVENRIKQLYPQLNLLSLDFDGSVSDVNITNRLLMLKDSLK